MSEGYTKLLNSITESTIWSENDETRIVWITMLAMSDRIGYVGASVPGLAARARVSLEATEAALAKFLAPDKYSRSSEYEGRRIAVVDRGWKLLNYERFCYERDDEARRAYKTAWQAQNRASKRPVTPSNTVDRKVSTVDGVDRSGPTQTETETETKTRKREESLPLGFDSEPMREAWKNWIGHRNQLKKPLTTNTINQLHKKFLEWGEQRSITAIEHTICMGWQGLREPEGSSTTKPVVFSDLDLGEARAQRERDMESLWHDG